MEKGHIFGGMGRNMKENIIKVRSMGKVNIIIMMGISTKVNGKKELSMEVG